MLTPILRVTVQKESSSFSFASHPFNARDDASMIHLELPLGTNVAKKLCSGPVCCLKHAGSLYVHLDHFLFVLSISLFLRLCSISFNLINCKAHLFLTSDTIVDTEDDDLVALEAACLPPGSISSSIASRSIPASIAFQLSPKKTISSHTRTSTLLPHVKHVYSQLSITKPSSSSIAKSPKPIELVLSSDSEDESASVVVVGSTEGTRNQIRPHLPTFSRDRILSNAALAPLKRPSTAMLANRQRRIDSAREKSPSRYLASSAHHPSRTSVKRNLLHYFGVFKEPRLQQRHTESAAAHVPSIEVVNLSVAVNRVVCRSVSPYSLDLDPIEDTDCEGMVKCSTLREIPWKSLLARDSYAAALLNPPDDAMDDLDYMRRYLQPLTTRVMPNGGFLFWFVRDNFRIAPVVRLCAQWHFHYVENMCCVLLNVNGGMIAKRAQNGAVCSQNKISLLVFRKNGPARLRHQRNVDVTFEIDRPWLKHYSRPYEYVYNLIETLISIEKDANQKFLEIWARPRTSRPGWTHLCIEKDLGDDCDECKAELKTIGEQEGEKKLLPDFHAPALFSGSIRLDMSEEVDFGVPLESREIGRAEFVLEESVEESNSEEGAILDDETLELVLSQREAVGKVPMANEIEDRGEDATIAWWTHSMEKRAPCNPSEMQSVGTDL